MAKKHKLAVAARSTVIVCILLMVVVVLNYLYSVHPQHVAFSNGRQQQLVQQIHGRADLRHFSFMNETLSGLNYELRRIIEHKENLQQADPLGRRRYPQVQSPPQLPVITTERLSSLPIFLRGHGAGADTAESAGASAAAAAGSVAAAAAAAAGATGAADAAPGGAVVGGGSSGVIADSEGTVRVVAATVTTTIATSAHLTKKALLYTMDSIASYEVNSKQGGASGELLIRHCLERAFEELHVALDVKTSDIAFESTDAKTYDIIIMDPWTWAAPGWVPKKHIRGLDERIYILDFFGAKKLRGSGLSIPPSRFLTAFDTSTENTFLGYYIDPLINGTSAKKQQGVIWGKDTRHFEERVPLLSHLANKVHLVSTATTPPFHHANIDWRGHQTSQGWLDILKESKFLVGLGDPLLGPSAIDAVATGCMFLNPQYAKPVRDGAFHSQHPYAAQKLSKYVCTYKINDEASLMKCVDTALATDVPPHIPADFTKEAYLQRVRHIFRL